jgi:hypothetical protein
MEIILAFALLVLAIPNQASTPPRLEIAPAGSVRTFGAAGFEHFRMDGRSYLSSANFWDGKDRLMAVSYPYDSLCIDLRIEWYLSGKVRGIFDK